MGYGRNNYRGYSRNSTSGTGSAPTAKQTAYLDALITKAGMTRREWEESVGLIEANPWGGRLRTEAITRANVSRWIDALQAHTSTRRALLYANRCTHEDYPCCGCE